MFNNDTFNLIAILVFWVLFLEVIISRRQNGNFSVRWFAGLALFGLASVVIFNLVVDPLGWHDYSPFEAIIFEDRDEKFDLYTHADPAPEALILGSSRSLKLSPQLIEDTCGIPALNMALSDAKPLDVLAVLNLAIETHPPQFVTLNLDPRMFFPTLVYGDSMFRTPFQPYLPYRWQDLLENYSILFKNMPSYYTTVQSLNRVYDEVTTSKPPPRLLDLLGDGRIRYEVYDVQLENGTFPGPVLQPGYGERYLNVRELDPLQTAAFDDLVQLATANDIAVYVFLSPVYPPTLAEIRMMPEYVAFQAKLQAFIETYDAQLTWYDFTDVATWGGDPDLFYDEIHYMDGNADRLLSIILEDACNAVQ